MRGAYVKLAERIYDMYENLKNGNSQELDYKLLLREKSWEAMRQLATVAICKQRKYKPWKLISCNNF